MQGLWPLEVPNVLSRVLRWATTGGLTFAVEAAIFWVCFQPSQSVFLANAFALPAATVFNYLMHHRFSFRSERNHVVAVRWYVVALGANYLMNSLLVLTFLGLGLASMVAKVLAVPIQAPISFAFLNYVVFRPRTSHSSE